MTDGQWLSFAPLGLSRVRAHGLHRRRYCRVRDHGLQVCVAPSFCRPGTLTRRFSDFTRRFPFLLNQYSRLQQRRRAAHQSWPARVIVKYLAAERPILAAVPPDGAAAELIRETGAGIVAAPDDVQGLGEALGELHSRWKAGTLDGTRLSSDDREQLGRGARVEELAEVLRSLAK